MAIRKRPGKRSFGDERTRAVLQKATIFSIVGLMLVFGTTGNYLLPPAYAASTLTVNGFALDGKQVGMWIVVQHEGSTVKTGFTPMTFTGDTGELYTIIARDYSDGSIFFDHWNDGSINRTRIITLDEDATLAAFYKTPDTLSHTLAVNAYDQNGDVRNMYTTIREDGTTIKTGFAPLIFEGTAGATYSVTVSNYASLAFDRWEDGSTERTRLVTLDKDVTITSHFIDAAKASVPSKEEEKDMYTLDINSAEMSGSAKTGMYTTIREGDTVVTTGFTPVSFAGTAGATYSVTVADYASSVFDHWDGGSIERTRTVTLNSDVTLTAYYGNINSAQHDLIDNMPQKTGVFVALYMYPGSTGSVHWQKVIDEKKEHPSVPIVAAFNPSSGPGSSRDGNIASWVAKLQDAGVTAIGYVADDYGTKSLSSLRSDTDKYVNWYGADGLFIDEFTNKAGYEGHYQQITDYAKSRGMELTMGNPGTDVPPSYIGTVDVINTSEGRGYTSLTDPNLVGSSWVSGGYSGWHEDHGKDNFSIIRYDTIRLDAAYVEEISKLVGLVYITDGNDSNHRWFHVPPYFGELVAALDR